MLLIENNELVHVDSASDILEHYGVKGMRWGKRKARLESRLAAHKRVIDGDAKSGARRMVKRFAVGTLATGNPLVGIAGAATYKGGAKRGYAKTANKLNKMDRKEHIEKALDAYQKSDKNKKLNKEYDTLEKRYNSVNSREVSLYDRSGRKQKKSDLRKISDKIDAVEKQQIESYNKSRDKAKRSFKPGY